MVRNNQIYMNHDDDIFVCTSCDNRHFPSAASLFQHCRSSKSHSDEWCERCQWLFVNYQARAAHTRSSDAHNICVFCGADLVHQAELTSHYAEAHEYCRQCDLVCHDYREHRSQIHRQCRECGEEFQNDNNLNMVSE